jgi:hypothetical protein
VAGKIALPRDQVEKKLSQVKCWALFFFVVNVFIMCFEFVACEFSNVVDPSFFLSPCATYFPRISDFAVALCAFSYYSQ